MENLITCYRCGGDGIIYKYDLNLGPSKKCPGCQGSRSLSSTKCIQCVKCKGTGQIYEYDNEIGQRINCPLCKNLGHTFEKYMTCTKCKGDGKLYPFPTEKFGVPKLCDICNSFGFVKEKNYIINQNNYSSGINNIYGNDYYDRNKDNNTNRYNIPDQSQNNDNYSNIPGNSNYNNYQNFNGFDQMPEQGFINNYNPVF